MVLAAGAGTRLKPLTDLRAKALCPVNNVPLVDHALARVRPVASGVACNVHHRWEQLVAHLSDRVHVSVEDEPLETAGALGRLRGWIDGRHVLVCNADVWHPDDLAGLLGGWDRERVRLLTVRDLDRPDFGNRRYSGAALVPWMVVRDLPAERLGLYRAVFEPHWQRGALELVNSQAPFFDCGTPHDYLAANLAASGGLSVVGDGAVVLGELKRSVVWPGARVERGERLVEAIRANADVTVQVGPGSTPPGTVIRQRRQHAGA